MYHKDAATVSYERHKEIKNELLFTWRNITDYKIFKRHLNLLPWYLISGKLPFLKGFLWALRYFIQVLIHRYQERKFIKVEDSEILDGCMKYYRNFERSDFMHLKPEDKKYILLVSRFLPYPLNVGGKVRIHNLYKLLKDKYNVILLSLIDFQEETKFTPELKNIFKEVYTVYDKSTLKLFFPSRYRYAYSKPLIEKLKEIQKRYPIDIIHIESNELLYLFDYIKHIPIVYTEHDISLMSFDGSYYKHKKYLFLQEFYDHLKRINFHNHYYSKINRVISLSKKDMEVIRSFFPNKNISYIPTGTDIDFFEFNYPNNGQKRIIYIGHYLHYPNEDAVVYFTKKVFSKIRKEISQAEFYIVGSSPTEEVRKLSAIEGVKVVGEVDEVKSWLYKSSIFVNPTRISAGIKGKVLEPMACGIPLVSTTKGAWGLEARPDKEILIADTPAEFANQIIKLFRNHELHHEIVVNARKLVEERYNWKNIASKLDGVYEEIISKYALLERKEYFVKDRFNTGLPERLYSILYRIKSDVEKYIENSSIDIPEFGPEELHLELTYSCQSRCVMCDVWDYEKRNKIKDNALGVKEIEQLIKQSSYLKRVKSIVLSGGEPFLRTDLMDICGVLISNFPSSCINILTNMIDTEKIVEVSKRIISEYNPYQLWLSTSMDGIGKVHDHIRGHRGAFNKLTKSIATCKEQLPDIKLAATFTVTPYNTNQFIKVKEFCERQGIDFFAQFSVQKDCRNEIIWTEKHFQEIQRSVNLVIKELIADKNYGQIKDDPGLMAQLYYWSYFVEYQRNPKRYFKKCVAGSRYAMFTPYGELFFCPILKDKVIGNIREKKFDKIWMSKESFQIRNYINEGNCHCWLLCAVHPLLIKVLNIKQDIERKEKVSSDREKIIIFPGEVNRIRNDTGYQKIYLDNAQLNKEEYISNKIILNSYPQEIGIGTHFTCNAKCKFCQGGDFPDFNLQVYKNFIEPKLRHVFSNTKNINFCGYGELLLIPQVEKFLDYLNQTLPQHKKIITTNGIPLKENIANFLIDNNYAIQVSLHASTPDLHKDITLTESFDKIIQNIENIINKRNEEKTAVCLKSTLSTLNIEDLPNLVSLAIKLGVDELDCNYLVIYNNAHFKLSCFFQPELTNEIFDRAEEITAKSNLKLNLPPRFNKKDYDGNGGNGGCLEPWKYFYVETQGSVTPCCFAAEHVGYLNKDDFNNVWNGKGYQILRRNLINMRHGNFESKSWCRYCYKNDPKNVNEISSHISFRPGVRETILHNFRMKR